MVFLNQKMYPTDGSPGLSVGDERNKVAEAENKLLTWYMEQLTVSKDFFSKKMRVE